MKELTTKFSEPKWLADSRMEAWESYLARPMPTERDEDWRRTEIAQLDLTRMQAVSLKQAKIGSLVNHFQGMTSTSLPEELQKQGVIFCDLKTAVEKHADKVRDYILQSCDADKFCLLNRALFNSGTFIYIPRGVTVTQPFVVGFEMDDENAAEFGVASFPRLIVVAEDNSAADVVVFLTSPISHTKNNDLSASVTDIHVKRGARVNYLELQNFADNVYYVQRLNSNVDQDGLFNSLSVAVGGKQTKSDIATFLKARGSTSKVLGVVLGSDSSKYSYNTIQEHNAPDTTSDINFRVALKDTSSSVYQGIIRVDKVAQRTAAYQSNKNLLLGGDAKADSIPKLEILADDVKCSHGATVGPVDREQLFYLRSRGLREHEAEQLVVIGFFRKVLEQFPIAATIDWVTELISQKIAYEGQND